MKHEESYMLGRDYEDENENILKIINEINSPQLDKDGLALTG